MILRRTITMLATLVATVPIGVAVTAGSASACSCAMQTDEQAFVDADVVFVGRLVEIVPPDPDADGSWRSDALERFVFEVSTVHKGDASERQVVVTAAGGESCGLELPPGGPYVMFARLPTDPGIRDGELSSSLCSGSRPLGNGPLPAGFGEGRPPTPANTTPDPTTPEVTPTPGDEPAATGPADDAGPADTDAPDEPITAPTTGTEHDDGVDAVGLLAVLAGSLLLGGAALLLASRSSLRRPT